MQLIAVNIKYYFWWRDDCFGLLIHHDAPFHFTLRLYTYTYIQFMTDAVVVYYGCQFYNSGAYHVGKSSYHTIYHCIVIQKWQYIDTPKLHIITPLIQTLYIPVWLSRA